MEKHYFHTQQSYSMNPPRAKLLLVPPSFKFHLRKDIPSFFFSTALFIRKGYSHLSSSPPLSSSHSSSSSAGLPPPPPVTAEVVAAKTPPATTSSDKQVLRIVRFDYMEDLCPDQFINPILDPQVFEYVPELNYLTLRCNAGGHVANRSIRQPTTVQLFKPPWPIKMEMKTKELKGE